MLAMLGDEKHTQIREFAKTTTSRIPPTNIDRKNLTHQIQEEKFRVSRFHGSFLNISHQAVLVFEPHTHFWPPEFSPNILVRQAESTRVNVKWPTKLGGPINITAFRMNLQGIGLAKHPHRINGLKYSTICPKNTSISPCKLDWKGLVPVDPTRRSTIIWNMLKHVGNLPKTWEIWEVSKLNWSFVGFFSCTCYELNIYSCAAGRLKRS